MRTSANLIVVGMLAALISGGCIGDSPEATVQKFYRHLNAGEYSDAKEMYDKHAKQLIDSALVGGFPSWAETETRQGTIENVEITSANIRGEGATVAFALVFKDGTRTPKSVLLTRESGTWRMGLVH